MKRLNIRLGTICLWIGVGLLALAILATALWQWRVHAAAQQAQACVQTLRALIPTPQSAAPQERRDNTMAALSVDKTDFVGILEMPRYDSALPVAAEWSRPSRYPCRLDGSVYDGSLQIGLTSQKGQYDFYREISVGDAVFFTDAEGNRYAYTVTDVRYERQVDSATLRRENAALTLFVKNVYGWDYIVIFCNTTN